MNVFISYDGDKIGFKVGEARLRDDVEEIRRTNQAINLGNELWASYALRHGGSVIESGGDEGALEVPPDALEEIPQICKQYEDLVGSTVSVGVGMKISESSKALLIAKIEGRDRVIFFSPEMDKTLEDLRQKQETQSESDKIAEEYLTKAEVELPQSLESRLHHYAKKQKAKDEVEEERTANARNVEELKSQVVGILQKLKQQTPTLESLKSIDPEVYQSIMDMAQAVIALGRQLTAENQVQKSEASPEETPEETKDDDKTELDPTKKPKKGAKLEKENLNNPSPYRLGGTSRLPVGTEVNQKQLVQHYDGKKSFVSLRAGKILSQDPTGHPISSRLPGGK